MSALEAIAVGVLAALFLTTCYGVLTEPWHGRDNEHDDEAGGGV